MRSEVLAEAVTTSRAAYDLAHTRYEHGLTDFVIALDAESMSTIPTRTAS